MQPSGENLLLAKSGSSTLSPSLRLFSRRHSVLKYRGWGAGGSSWPGCSRMWPLLRCPFLSLSLSHACTTLGSTGNISLGPVHTEGCLLRVASRTSCRHASQTLLLLTLPGMVELGGRRGGSYHPPWAALGPGHNCLCNSGVSVTSSPDFPTWLGRTQDPIASQLSFSSFQFSSPSLL